MKRAVFITGIVVLAAAVAASGAFAQGPGKGQRITFEELDANGDGEITMAELEARQAARFAAADTDGDGKLTAAELTARANARVEKRVNKMLERHDANGDGA
ncbi:MAG: calcium-binding protein, partial [Pseudomonadota bacterium]